MTAWTSSPAPCARFVRRLGPHHFAYLRAVAEGLDLGECARRYLGVAHGHEAVTAHQEAVDAVRSVARRRGEAAWRLVGLRIQALSAGQRPPLDDFAAGHGLEGFSEAEVLALYEQAHPLERKAARPAPEAAPVGAPAPPGGPGGRDAAAHGPGGRLV